MLTALKIKGFRALEDFVVPKLGRVNLIVGKNNSGKSTVLEALELYAGNANFNLLEKLANSHDERSRFHDEAIDSQPEDLPFASFFTGRKFPDSDEGIEIGDPNTSDFLTIQHGYQIEQVERISRNGAEFSRVRSIRISKSDTDLLETDPVSEAIFVNRGDFQFSLPLKEELRPGARLGILPFLKGSIPCAVVPTQFVDVNDLADEWDRIALTDSQEVVKKALQLIAPNFVDISFVRSDEDSSRPRYSSSARRTLSRTAKVRLRDHDRPVPLGSMGDGMLRVLQLVLKVFSAKGGFLLIDEFENGLHYSVQEKVWGQIFDLAEELNIQIFATTHSWDCIESFAKVALAKSGTEGVLFRVGRSARTSENGKVIATVFDEEQLFNITQADVEVR